MLVLLRLLPRLHQGTYARIAAPNLVYPHCKVVSKLQEGVSVVQFTCITDGSIKMTASALILTCKMTIKHASPRRIITSRKYSRTQCDFGYAPGKIAVSKERMVFTIRKMTLLRYRLSVTASLV